MKLIGNYAIVKYITLDEVEMLRPMERDLYYEMVVMMTRKSSVLIPSLNKFISIVYQSGLPLYWEAQVSFVMNTLSSQRL